MLSRLCHKMDQHDYTDYLTYIGLLSSSFSRIQGRKQNFALRLMYQI